MMARCKEPTVLDAVTPEVTVARGQTSGPAATILRWHDASEAERVANGTPFRLRADVSVGGAKEWQHGREIGILGAREFTNPKTVWTGPASL